MRLLEEHEGFGDDGIIRESALAEWLSSHLPSISGGFGISEYVKLYSFYNDTELVHTPSGMDRDRIEWHGDVSDNTISDVGISFMNTSVPVSDKGMVKDNHGRVLCGMLQLSVDIAPVGDKKNLIPVPQGFDADSFAWEILTKLKEYLASLH